ncbi:MAG: choice-of-anchor D domain-containing protein [Candidatus Kapaibacterium sp.]
MKHIHCSISSLGFVLVMLSLSGSPSQAQWEKVLTTESRVAVIYFYNSDLGFVAVGAPSSSQILPMIYRTEDGGNTWSAASTPGNKGFGVNDIIMEDEHNGWAGSDNNNGRIWRTVDGGKTWNALSDNYPYDRVTNSVRKTAAGLVFSDFMGWDIEMSYDNGKSLTEVYPTGNDYILGMDFVDSIHGAAMTNFRSTNPWSYTSDGGVTWHPSNFGIECWTVRGMKGTKTFYAIPEGLSTIDTYQSEVMRSDNYGVTWNKIRTLPFRSTSDVEISGSAMYVQTSAGSCYDCSYPDGKGIYRSLDSGKTWNGIGGPDYWNDSRFAVINTCNGTAVYCADVNNNIYKIIDTTTRYLNTSNGPLYTRILLPAPITVTDCQTGETDIRIWINDCYKLVLTQEMIEGKDSQYFSLLHSPLPTVLDGSADSIRILVTPGDTGKYQAHLHITGYYDYGTKGTVPFDTIIAVTVTVKPSPIKFEADKSTIALSISPCTSLNEATVSLMNNGCDTITVDSGPGNIAPFMIEDLNLPLVLPPSGFKKITVRFIPDSLNTHTTAAVFHARSRYDERYLVIGLTAKKDAHMKFEMDKSSIVFNISSCISNYETTLSLINRGCDTLTVDSGPGNVAPFIFENMVVPFRLLPYESKTIRVRYIPDSLNAYSTSAIFHARSSIEDQWQVVSLIVKKEEKVPELVSPSSALNFQTVLLCDASKKLGLTLTNPGCDSIRITSASMLPPEFALAGISFPIIIPPKASVTIGVTFHPIRTGDFSDTLVFTLENQALTGSMKVLLLGAAKANTPQVAASAWKVNFPAISTCEKPRDTAIVLRNTGCDTLAIISGPGILPPEFIMSNVPLPLILAPSDSVVYAVTFRPSGSGSFSAAPTFIAERFGVQTPVEISLHGEGIQGLGMLATSPGSFSFLPATICSPAFTLEGTIENTGCDSLVVDGIALSQNSAFGLNANTFPVYLAPGEAAHYEVYSSLRIKGEYTDSLTIDAHSSHEKESLFRNIIPITAFVGDGSRSCTIDRTDINYGWQTVCAIPDSAVRISNTGCDTVTIASGIITGSGFFIHNVTFPVVLEPGKSLRIPVGSFADTTGRKLLSEAVLEFESNDVSPIAQVYLYRENTYPVVSEIMLGEGVKNGNPGDTIELQIYSKDNIHEGHTLDLDIEYNTDLLGFIRSYGPNTTDVSNRHLHLTGSPTLRSDNGVLTTMVFEVYLTSESATDIVLTNAHLNESEPSYEECIASVKVRESTTRFISGYSCGEQTISKSMNSRMPLKITAIYPNPATTSIAIDFDSPLLEDGVLEIFDALGNNKYYRGISGNSKKMTVDITSIPSGVYMARVLCGNIQATAPFIKKD